MKTKKLNLRVSGMTCASCEVIIERSLRKVKGVKKVSVNRGREEVRITCDGNLQIESLQDALKGKGYSLSQNAIEDPIENSPRQGLIAKNPHLYAEIGAIFLFIIGAYLILRQFDLLPKGLGVSENMSYFFIFLIGLVAASSTCLAVAGGLLMAVAAKFNDRHARFTGWQKFQPHIYFNAGRIISYTLLGGLVGLLGSVFTLSPKITGLVTLAASTLMIIMGIQLLQVFPWANRLQLKMPKFIAHKLYDASHRESREAGKTSSFLFGASTFFLPCGFTQALQLYVLGKGSFIAGALTMLVFSLGTLPSLIGIGAFSSFAKGTLQRRLITFSAVLVIILGFFNIPNGLALTGASISLDFNFNNPYLGAAGNEKSAGENAQMPDAKIVDGKQVVEMKVVGLDYYPHKFRVLQGIPVEWRVDGTQAEGCAQVISVPKFGLTEFLPRSGTKTIEFLPKEAGKISFSCTMGMTTYGAEFEVLPNTGEVPGNSYPGQEGQASEDSGECKSEIMSCNTQKISMEISREKGFYPNVHVIKNNIPVEMEIDTKLRLGGCMGTLVIPEYGTAHLLSMGKTTMKFIPTKRGTFPFTCSMGSKMGEFIVV